VKIIVDSNIAFSAILNTSSNIGQILLVGSKYFDFLSVNFLKFEITKHKKKIKQISGYDEEKYFNIYKLISKFNFSMKFFYLILQLAKLLTIRKI